MSDKPLSPRERVDRLLEGIGSHATQIRDQVSFLDRIVALRKRSADDGVKIRTAYVPLPDSPSLHSIAVPVTASDVFHACLPYETGTQQKIKEHIAVIYKKLEELGAELRDISG